MAASIPEAMEKARKQWEERHQPAPPPAPVAPPAPSAPPAPAAAALLPTLADWARDDEVHVDPPIAQPQEQPMFDADMNHATTPAPASAQSSRPSKTITQTTFEYIRDNDGLLRPQVTSSMVTRYGFKRDSVSSLIGQMVVQGLIYYDADRRLHAARREFQPLKSGAVREKLMEAHRLELKRTSPNRYAGYIKMGITRRIRAAERRGEHYDPAAHQQQPESTMPATKAARKPRPDLLQKRQAAAAHAREVLADKRKKADRERKRAERAAAAAQQGKVPTTGRVMRLKSPHVKSVAQLATEAVGENPTLAVRNLTAEQIVAAMSIVQARTVFEKLSDFFGGK